MSDLFVKLMEQIQMPLEMRNSSAFSSGDIIEVKVHSVSRLWEFHFSFAELLPIEIYQELAYRLKYTFEVAEIKIKFDIAVENPEFSDQLLQAYYKEAFEHEPCNGASFKSSFAKLKVAFQDGQVQILTPDFVNNDHFRQNHIPNLVKQFKDFGFGELEIIMVSDSEMTQTLQESFDNSRQAILAKPFQSLLARLQLS